ncbi:MAG TPA: hypothetical protein VGF28_12305 [Thermoanaerobaculia bacterium]|jgi:hypothetical protein
MSDPSSRNRAYVLRLWIPVLLFCTFVGVLVVLALTSGDPARSGGVFVGLVFAALLIAGTRWRQKRRIGAMFRSEDPGPALRAFETSLRRIPHGAHFAAANSATILALYGRTEEGERILEDVVWQGVPPLVQAQEPAARAVIAYVRGAVTEGLDHAVMAGQQAALDPAFPGATTAAVAFRTYRNLGMALAGRATPTTAEELRGALTRLPLLGQILAAWGLALIARGNGDAGELRSMQDFVQQRAPHLEPVLRSIAG